MKNINIAKVAPWAFLHLLGTYGQLINLTPQNYPILVRPVAVEITKPYPLPIMKIPVGNTNSHYYPPPGQQDPYNYMYSSSPLDKDYLASEEDIPFFDYYEYGGPPDYGGGGWFGPFPPPPPPPPSSGGNKPPVKGKPKPKPGGVVDSSSSPGGSGWSEGPAVTTTGGEGDKEKDKLSQLKDKWNSFLDKFKLKDKDKDKDKDKVKGKEPEKKPIIKPTSPPTQGSGWGNPSNNGWAQPSIPHPPPWVSSNTGPSNSNNGKPILEIWLGPLWGDDPSEDILTTTISPTSDSSREETTITSTNANSNVTTTVLPLK